MKESKLFVVFDDLNASESDTFISRYGTDWDGDYIDGTHASQICGKQTTIVTLKDVAPKLHAEISAVSSAATLTEIQHLAKAIVAEAVKADATHFFCTGEPVLTMWANLYAAKHQEMLFAQGQVSESGRGWCDNTQKTFDTRHKPMTCIQSTPEGKWTEMF